MGRIAVTDLIDGLRELVAKWRRLAKADAIAGVNQALVDDREYFGRVNAAIATRQCMEELEEVIASAAVLPQPAFEQVIAEMREEMDHELFLVGNHPAIGVDTVMVERWRDRLSTLTRQEHEK